MSKETLIGKTIKSIDSSACNVWKFEFTDGTKTEIWADCAGGPLSVPFVDVVVNGENITEGPN